MSVGASDSRYSELSLSDQMAVAEDVDQGFAVEKVIAADAAPGVDIAAMNVVAGIVDAVSGLETVVERAAVEVIDGEAVDVEPLEGVVAAAAVAEGAEQVALAVAGWNVRVERLAEHCELDVDFAEGIQDDFVQDDKIEDVVAGYSVAGSAGVDCEEDNRLVNTVVVAAAEELAYAQEKKSVVKAMTLQIVFPLAF
ncbi:hypothetical protein FSPOR_4258 [Fusarium sporotrichioides]|uniref:Uncharacterized protein n=1 Tax=Fusarium sporotrichioides TaxID=5514 RepID=A0A395SCK6_FUSSP|nr:hypothetical protein FSPOR_4258 [Fusarium sporotrichioides]